ncbi:hypothetical protein BJV82DRAFT_592848 [Fennellomyces sp. T-0311]|nr:hypothetical protein BJV82DRAFT_592848 [Fennellomyces sp. T-0311]
MPDFQKSTQTHYLGKHGRKTIYVGNVDSEFLAYHGHPQGSYVAAILVDAILQFASSHRVVALNAFFFKPSVPGPCVVELEELKTSDRGYCVTQAVLKQLRTPAPLTTIAEYDPALYIAKLHTVITTTKKEGGYTYIGIDNQPSAPAFDSMKASPIHIMRGGDKVLAMYENLDYSNTGEVLNAFEWPSGESIDAKSLVCFGDISSVPKPLARNEDIIHMPRLTLQFEISFREPPTKPVKRVLAKVIMSDIIGSNLDADGWLFDQDGYLLATARHHITFADDKIPKKSNL